METCADPATSSTSAVARAPISKCCRNLAKQRALTFHLTRLPFVASVDLQNVRQGEAEHLPYEDGSFDLVTGLDVVEHLDDDVAGLREMRRVLRPGGYAFLFVPAFMFLWGVQDDMSHHRRRYTLAGLQRVVRAAGFEIERATYANITFLCADSVGQIADARHGFRPASENNLTDWRR